MDYLVVGSGCSGAVVAQTLVDAGLNVTMLDAGIEKDNSLQIPDKDFISIRKTEADQHKYLIGERADGASWSKTGKGEQITPPRKHIMEDVDKFLPVDSKTFSPLESLGYGGLGIGWGLQCWEYSKADLSKAGLDPSEMAKAYQAVGDRIGVSATKDEAAKYTIGSLKSYHDSPSMDRNHQRIYQKYQAKNKSFNEQGFYLGRTPLALITKDMGKRKKYSYQDMDFYSDNDQSAWRPWITVNELKKKKNFKYVGGYLVLRFDEKKDHIEVTALSIKDQTQRVFSCHRLILATSALGSARVVLRSLGDEKTKLPILCNPYSYIPTIQPKFLGKEAEPKKLGLTQLSMFLDEDNNNSNTSVASLYSYQSLMLFRIIKQASLNFVDTRVIMRYLMSGIVIAGIHHPDNPSSLKYIRLVKDAGSPTGDKLNVKFELKPAEKSENQRREAKFRKAMRRLGIYSMRTIDPGIGSSIHYAGTLPFSKTAKPFHLHPSGRLHGTKNVFVADSSGFKFLPAPGLTFSLIANAHLVGERLVKNA